MDVSSWGQQLCEDVYYAHNRNFIKASKKKKKFKLKEHHGQVRTHRRMPQPCIQSSM
jgi:hypothetical protein